MHCHCREVEWRFRAVFRGGAGGGGGGGGAVILPRFEEKYKLPLKGVV